MNEFTPDQLVVDNERYQYRNGTWTNERGMMVSLSQSQRMTLEFYQLNGRAPRKEQKRRRRRATAKSSAKAVAVRAAIARATSRR
jgi:hypothetical protein